MVGANILYNEVSLSTSAGNNVISRKAINIQADPANGWAKIPNYNDSTTFANTFPTFLYPEVNPSSTSPNHIKG